MAYLFIDTCNSNELHIGMNELTVNDSEICVSLNNEAWSIPEKSVMRFCR